LYRKSSSACWLCQNKLTGYKNLWHSLIYIYKREIMIILYKNFKCWSARNIFVASNISFLSSIYTRCKWGIELYNDNIMIIVITIIVIIAITVCNQQRLIAISSRQIQCIAWFFFRKEDYLCFGLILPAAILKTHAANYQILWKVIQDLSANVPINLLY
jgi:hypothetical protein